MHLIKPVNKKIVCWESNHLCYLLKIASWNWSWNIIIGVIFIIDQTRTKLKKQKEIKLITKLIIKNRPTFEISQKTPQTRFIWRARTMQLVNSQIIHRALIIRCLHFSTHPIICTHALINVLAAFNVRPRQRFF
jgi:hypothetical protein